MSNVTKLIIGGVAALALGTTGLAVARAEGNERDEQAVQIGDVPAAVQKTIQQQFQDATIQRIEKRNERGQTTYDVYSMKNGKATETVIDEDGRVLRAEATGRDDDDDD